MLKTVREKLIQRAKTKEIRSLNITMHKTTRPNMQKQ
jgi:hypothetical protein